MNDEIMHFNSYIQALQKELATGNTTEHTHQPAFKGLIESLDTGVIATNEPGRIKCGAPDFVVTKGVPTIAYIEAKDIGINLDVTEKSDQLKRYLKSLTNLILTDYLEFRWYVDGEKRLSARLGTVNKNSKIKRDKEGFQTVTNLVGCFLAEISQKCWYSSGVGAAHGEAVPHDSRLDY